MLNWAQCWLIKRQQESKHSITEMSDYIIKQVRLWTRQSRDNSHYRKDGGLSSQMVWSCEEDP